VGLNEDATVERCSAAGGSVTSSIYYAGGIVGYNSGESSITNCYATIGVKNADYRASGIVGSQDAGCSVEYCYATGSVEGYYSGGISGSSTGSTANSVALNTSITGTLAFRVYYNIGKNNYARSDIPGTWTNQGPNNYDGADVSPGTAATQYNNQAWWTTAANWDGAPWDFDTIWKMSNGNNLGSLPVLR